VAAYYNEHDPYAAQWLRNLIAAGHIAAGDVDERSIVDVCADDLQGFTQCHFFAGIGGWSLALRIAGWPDDRPVWTGSCPCQPLSSSGARRGHADERHLWPAFHRLIAECRVPVVFGEQVAGKDGREWLAGVRADLEALGHAVGAADLCAAGIGAPHMRQRLFWVGYANGRHERWQPGRETGPAHQSETEVGVEDRQRVRTISRGASEAGGLADAERDFERREDRDEAGQEYQTLGYQQFHLADKRRGRPDPIHGGLSGESFYAAADVLPFRDGKARRVEPGSFPLAAGIPVDMGKGRSRADRVAIGAARAHRLGSLRGYGNAINPIIAAEFIAAADAAVKEINPW
jgi:DNA (cytosine-5)-methyltransferase 1